MEEFKWRNCKYPLRLADINIMHTLRSIKRLTQIVRTLARYNLLTLLCEVGISAKLVRIIHSLAMISQKQAKDLVSKTRGERLAIAFTALGPIFIKLGQIVLIIMI